VIVRFPQHRSIPGGNEFDPDLAQHAQFDVVRHHPYSWQHPRLSRMAEHALLFYENALLQSRTHIVDTSETGGLSWAKPL